MINAYYSFCMMLASSSKKKTLYFEIFKLITISFPLFVGGIIFSYFFSKGSSSLRNYLFYLFVSVLLIFGQIILFFIRRQRILGNEFQSKSLSSTVPSTLSQGSTSSPKESIKIDEHSVSYCLSCGKSFTKKYSFCPKCGSCKISSFI